MAAEKKNNEKFVKAIKQFMLLIGILGVVGGGSFIANYWQDREAVRRNSADIRGHEDRVRLLENNQAKITQALESINKNLDEFNKDQKTMDDKIDDIKSRVSKLEVR